MVRYSKLTNCYVSALVHTEECGSLEEEEDGQHENSAFMNI